MGLMPVTDAMFMLPENREQPMHVGGLQVFELPKGAGPDWVSELYAQALAATDISPLFRRRAHRGALTAGQWAWEQDDDVDLEHHVRLSALPRPARVRELLALVSRLHGTLLDRQRPLWEAHLIEGLEGDRFAVYTKVHHAMMDGVSAMRLLGRSLSTDASSHTGLPWEVQQPGRGEGASLLSWLPGLAAGAVVDAATLTPRLAKIAVNGLREETAMLPMQAPTSMLNVSITGSRRFAAQSWPLARIRGVAKGSGGTVNDVVLAMCSNALRDYMLELGELPDAPLVAMTPVSLHADDTGPSNAVSTILCNLATDEPDPRARLEVIHESMRQGKTALKTLSSNQMTAIGGIVMAPLLFNGMIGAHKLGRQAFNVIISNVPGPPETLYWNGARLTGMYPLSIPTHGQALNITVTSYAGELHFGLTGCRRSLPHLQRMLAGLENGLADLEEAYAEPATTGGTTRG
jgi:diacylglycerol O-acyltransferase